jgi:hypothetical protein
VAAAAGHVGDRFSALASGGLLDSRYVRFRPDNALIGLRPSLLRMYSWCTDSLDVLAVELRLRFVSTASILFFCFEKAKRRGVLQFGKHIFVCVFALLRECIFVHLNWT